jgi:hypothetical protein
MSAILSRQPWLRITCSCSVEPDDLHDPPAGAEDARLESRAGAHAPVRARPSRRAELRTTLAAPPSGNQGV